MFLISVAESDIESVEKELSLNKSADYICLNTKVIKHVIPNTSNQQCYIGYKSFADGRCLGKMKIAEDIPMYKSDDGNLCSIYRPISFLPHFF